MSLASLWTARLLRLQPRRGPRISGQRVRDALEAPRWAILLGIVLFVLLFLVVLVLLAVTPAAAGQGINFDQPTKKWYQGPVRYIITHQEVKAYKALETTAERATFIDWFWQRRDIVPSTSENEFRDRFEKRVYEATRKFGYTATPGWKTDMGKIYILVGPPDDTTTDMMPRTHRGVITWTYRNPPFPDMPINTVIAFAQDVTGEFRLSTTPTLDSDVARGLQFSRVKRTEDDRYLIDGMTDPMLLDQGVSLSQSQLETRMIYGRMQQLPPREEELFQGFVKTKESYGTAIPMETRFDYYRGETGKTFTTVTVGIRSSSVQYRSQRGKDVPDVGVFGKLINVTNPDETFPLAGDSAFTEGPDNAQAGAGDLLMFQAVGAFAPGPYRAILGVEDRVSRKISSTNEVIDVPDMAVAGLHLSSITLAASMEPQEYAATVAKPFQIGKFRLVPRPKNEFLKSEELNVYLQVYNPEPEPGVGHPKMDVYYTFASVAADGTAKDFGTYRVQDSPAQVQGYAVPLEKWPEGQYRLTVRIVDKVAQKEASRDVTFYVHS